MTLTEWLKEKGTSQEAFAAVVGASQGQISRLLSGARGPGLDLAMKIEKATAGAVPASSWVEKKSRHARRVARTRQ
jgi:transcriptional regulator with XRE-family HTH domain